MKHKDLYLNYFFEFLLNFDLTHAIWPTFLVLKGFSLVDVGISESIFHLTSLLGEMPTGMISDIYGRKMSRFLSRVMAILSTVLLLLSQNRWMVYLSFMMSALSYNLESGTDSAYVYDLLESTGEKEQFTKVQGVREIILQAAGLLAAVIGGALADVSYHLSYLCSLLIGVAALLTLGKMKEFGCHQKRRSQGLVKSMKQKFCECWLLLKGDRQLLYLILSYALFSATVTTCHYYLTNAWKELGIAISHISLILAMENFAGIISGMMAYRVISKRKPAVLLTGLPLLMVVVLGGIPFFPISAVAICVLGFLESILYIAVTTFLNQRVDSLYRATLLSGMSMAFSLMMIVYFPFVGWLGEQFSLTVAFVGLFFLNAGVYILYYFTVCRRLKI